MKQVSIFFIPSRILYSANIVKGERRIKYETGFDIFIPSRILYSANIGINVRLTNKMTEKFDISLAYITIGGVSGR